MQTPHSERAHSKFSASGSERWLNCPGSVALEEACPDSDDNPWAREGTIAHEWLEKLLTGVNTLADVPQAMYSHLQKTMLKIKFLHAKTKNSVLLIEKKIFNTFIHEEMFGTCDAVIAQAGGELHIADFKYGSGHIVDPRENTQLIQYALGAAESYDWDFKTAHLHILQPRAGEEWFKTWTFPAKDLKEKWLPLWEKGVARVEGPSPRLFEGHWCHWCKARAANTCPLKEGKRVDKITNVFETSPLTKGITNGKASKASVHQESEASGGKEKSRQETKGKNPFEAESEVGDFY